MTSKEREKDSSLREKERERHFGASSYEDLEVLQRALHALPATLEWEKESWIYSLEKAGTAAAKAHSKLEAIVLGAPAREFRFDPTLTEPWSPPPHDAAPADAAAGWCFFAASAADSEFETWWSAYRGQQGTDPEANRAEFKRLAERCPRVRAGLAPAVAGPLGLPFAARRSAKTAVELVEPQEKQPKSEAQRADSQSEDRSTENSRSEKALVTDCSIETQAKDRTPNLAVQEDTREPRDGQLTPSTPRCLQARERHETHALRLADARKMRESACHHPALWVAVPPWVVAEDSVGLPAAAWAMETPQSILDEAVAELPESHQEHAQALCKILRRLPPLPSTELYETQDPGKPADVIAFAVRAAQNPELAQAWNEFRHAWTVDLNLLQLPALCAQAPDLRWTATLEGTLEPAVPLFKLELSSWKALVSWRDPALREDQEADLRPKHEAALAANNHLLAAAAEAPREHPDRPLFLWRRLWLWGCALAAVLPSADDYIPAVISGLSRACKADPALTAACCWAADCALAVLPGNLSSAPPVLLAGWTEAKLRLKDLPFVPGVFDRNKFELDTSTPLMAE